MRSVHAGGTGRDAPAARGRGGVRPARRTWPALLALLLLGVAPPLAAQRGPRLQAAPDALRPPPLQVPRTTTAGAAFLASAIVPGAGQFLQGSERWIPYALAEAWGWVSYADRRSDTRKLEARYRDLARSVPRRVSSGARPDTIFEYYEALANWTSSGAWDIDPGRAGVQPEVRLGTFNGEIWALAVGIYLPAGSAVDPSDPAYQAALAYYMERAIPPDYAWAWGNNDLERQVFRELIRESDEAFRDATTLLGAILANHLVSAVDAFVLARLRATDNAPDLRIRNGLEGTFQRPLWSASLELRFQ